LKNLRALHGAGVDEGEGAAGTAPSGETGEAAGVSIAGVTPGKCATPVCWRNYARLTKLTNIAGFSY
jgi:hypothetical protein